MKILKNKYLQITLAIILFAVASEMDYQDYFANQKNKCERSGGTFLEVSISEYACFKSNK